MKQKRLIGRALSLLLVIALLVTGLMLPEWKSAKAASSTPSGVNDAILRAAVSQLGKGYGLSGFAPSTEYDYYTCDGLVYYAMTKAGFSNVPLWCGGWYATINNMSLNVSYKGQKVETVYFSDLTKYKNACDSDLYEGKLLVLNTTTTHETAQKNNVLRKGMIEVYDDGTACHHVAIDYGPVSTAGLVSGTENLGNYNSAILVNNAVNQLTTEYGSSLRKSLYQIWDGTSTSTVQDNISWNAYYAGVSDYTLKYKASLPNTSYKFYQGGSTTLGRSWSTGLFDAKQGNFANVFGFRQYYTTRNVGDGAVFRIEAMNPNLGVTFSNFSSGSDGKGGHTTKVHLVYYNDAKDHQAAISMNLYEGESTAVSSTCVPDAMYVIVKSGANVSSKEMRTWANEANQQGSPEAALDYWCKKYLAGHSMAYLSGCIKTSSGGNNYMRAIVKDGANYMRSTQYQTLNTGSSRTGNFYMVQIYAPKQYVRNGNVEKLTVTTKYTTTEYKVALNNTTLTMANQQSGSNVTSGNSQKSVGTYQVKSKGVFMTYNRTYYYRLGLYNYDVDGMFVANAKYAIYENWDFATGSGYNLVKNVTTAKSRTALLAGNRIGEGTHTYYVVETKSGDAVTAYGGVWAVTLSGSYKNQSGSGSKVTNIVYYPSKKDASVSNKLTTREEGFTYNEQFDMFPGYMTSYNLYIVSSPCYAKFETVQIDYDTKLPIAGAVFAIVSDEATARELAEAPKVEWAEVEDEETGVSITVNVYDPYKYIQNYNNILGTFETDENGYALYDTHTISGKTETFYLVQIGASDGYTINRLWDEEYYDLYYKVTLNGKHDPSGNSTTISKIYYNSKNYYASDFTAYRLSVESEATTNRSRGTILTKGMELEFVDDIVTFSVDGMKIFGTAYPVEDIEEVPEEETTEDTTQGTTDKTVEIIEE